MSVHTRACQRVSFALLQATHPGHEGREALPVDRFRRCQRHRTKGAPVKPALQEQWHLATRTIQSYGRSQLGMAWYSSIMAGCSFDWQLHS